MKINQHAMGLVLDAALAFLAFVAALYIHMGSILWTTPSEVILKYCIVLTMIFLALALWTYIPYLRQVHTKTLIIFGLFSASVHIVYWPCTILMGRYYPVPPQALITSACLLFAMSMGWRLLVQLSRPLIRSHTPRHGVNSL